jgi:type II secretory pathway component GspD/PulD (secretin)
VPLRYVSAEEAFAALKEKLGPEASAAVGVDVPKNALTLDPLHDQAPKIREFLAKFDVRSPQLLVQATITRHIEATKTEPARDVVISRPTIVTQEGRPCVIKIPGQDGTTSVELRIESTPRMKE